MPPVMATSCKIKKPLGQYGDYYVIHFAKMSFEKTQDSTTPKIIKLYSFQKMKK